MLTEPDVHRLIPGQLVHGDDRCESFRVTSVRPVKAGSEHFEAWAISSSGALVVRITCNSVPGFHRASDHEPLPKLRVKIKLKRPPIKHRSKRAKRAKAA